MQFFYVNLLGKCQTLKKAPPCKMDNERRRGETWLAVFVVEPRVDNKDVHIHIS